MGQKFESYDAVTGSITNFYDADVSIILKPSGPIIGPAGQITGYTPATRVSSIPVDAIAITDAEFQDAAGNPGKWKRDIVSKLRVLQPALTAQQMIELQRLRRKRTVSYQLPRPLGQRLDRRLQNVNVSVNYSTQPTQFNLTYAQATVTEGHIAGFQLELANAENHPVTYGPIWVAPTASLVFADGFFRPTGGDASWIQLSWDGVFGNVTLPAGIAGNATPPDTQGIPFQKLSDVAKLVTVDRTDVPGAPPAILILAYILPTETTGLSYSFYTYQGSDFATWDTIPDGAYLRHTRRVGDWTQPPARANFVRTGLGLLSGSPWRAIHTISRDKCLSYATLGDSTVNGFAASPALNGFGHQAAVAVSTRAFPVSHYNAGVNGQTPNRFAERFASEIKIWELNGAPNCLTYSPYSPNRVAATLYNQGAHGQRHSSAFTGSRHLSALWDSVVPHHATAGGECHLSGVPARSGVARPENSVH